MLVHACQRCGRVRHNRIAADDDFELVLRLPVLPPGHLEADDDWEALSAS
jgi:hypothetical protein